MEAAQLDWFLGNHHTTFDILSLLYWHSHSVEGKHSSQDCAYEDKIQQRDIGLR